MGTLGSLKQKLLDLASKGVASEPVFTRSSRCSEGQQREIW